jgi:HD domain
VNAIGSPAWVADTGGTLTRRDQLRFTLDAIGRELSETLSRLRGGPLGTISASEVTVPDSALVRDIADEATRILPLPVLNHSLRTWMWGELLGRLDGIDYDAELLHVAALLHDIGLAEGHRPPPGSGCFAVHGGDEAQRMLNDHGADPAFADGAAQAIAAHFNVRVPLAWGAEAHLLHAGAHLDVVGRRVAHLPAAAVTEVNARLPREGFADFFIDAMKKEARSRPRSRAGLLWRLGMRRAIRRSPFREEARP